MHKPYHRRPQQVSKESHAVTRTLALLVLALCLVFTGQAWSQAASGTISGTVTDQTGAVIPNASVVFGERNHRRQV